MTKLREIRLKNNLKLREISEKTGILSSSLSMYETGARKIGIYQLKKLAELYNCKIDDLID